MACYKRIYYIDYYENDCLIKNAGFLKFIQWRKRDNDCEEHMCLQVYISGFVLEGEVTGAVKVKCGSRDISLGQVTILSGKGMAQVVSLEDVFASLETEGAYENIYLRVEIAANRYFECMLKEAEAIVDDRATLEAAEVSEVVVKAADDLEVIPDMMLSEQEEAVKIPESDLGQTYKPQEYKEKTLSEQPTEAPPAHDKWQQLWAVLPHMCPFEDEREYLKVDLKDMIIFPNSYYKVIENSFLLHGYYNFEHLILTKIYKKGRERCYIGVPGNYYEREARVAVMFGFESFEPKEEPPKEGDFGYYMIGVEI